MGAVVHIQAMSERQVFLAELLRRFGTEEFGSSESVLSAALQDGASVDRLFDYLAAKWSELLEAEAR